MRKFETIAVFICIIALIALCGCDKREEDAAANPTAAPAQAPTQTPAALLENAPETYNATWKSNTGITVINVDARVEAPRANAYPVVSADIRDITQDEAFTLANIVFTEGYEGDTALQEAENAQRKTYSLELNDKRQIRNLPEGYVDLITSYERGILAHTRLSYQRLQGAHKYYYSTNGHDTALIEGSIPGSAYDYESAYALAQYVASALAPELTLSVASSLRGEVFDPHDGDIVFAPVDAYMFRFYRSVNGVPVTYTRESGIRGVTGSDLSKEDYLFPYVWEKLYIVISDVGVYAVIYETPYAPAEILIENPSLLPFDQIINVAREIMPLMYASDEREAESNIIDIDCITLGYMRVQRRDMPGKYMLTPVWDFFGNKKRTLIDYGERGTPLLNQSMCTINAIDGTVIDRGWGY